MSFPITGATFIPNVADVKLPDLLGPDGYIKLLPAQEYDRMDRLGLRVWCHQHARYGLPTVELIDWLRSFIGGRRAIEIGAGAGDLSHHLGVIGTDSKVQTDNPTAVAYYRMLQQPAIRYPAAIEKLDALDAIAKYKPEVVIASWVTHWVDPDLPLPPGGGCVFGVHEDQVLAAGVTYVMIGNLGLTGHRHKPIRKLPHQELALPFIRSRAADPSLDRILIWEPANA